VCEAHLGAGAGPNLKQTRDLRHDGVGGTTPAAVVDDHDRTIFIAMG
jgi:hypothetical protein